jgi:hypothetical protein
MVTTLLINSTGVIANTTPGPSKTLLPVRQTQKTYPLVCRGGNVFVWFGTTSEISNKPQFAFIFYRAKFGIGQFMEKLTQLKPGECTWMDRPLSQNEPDRVAILSPIVSSNVSILKWPEGPIQINGAPVMNEIMNSSNYVIFDVYNNGAGYMIATDYRKVSK